MALLKYLPKKAARPDEVLFLEQGKPLVFGANQQQRHKTGWL